MKKKKLLTLITGIALVASAAALTACTPKDGEDGKDNVTKYTVTYVSGVESVTENAPAAASYAEGETFTISENTFTYEGYTFTGWNDGTTTYQAKATYTMPAKAVTFTAQWTEKQEEPSTPTTYAITFVGGEGTTGTAPTIANKAEGTKFNLPANTFTKTGYTFTGWNDGTKTYAADAEYTMPAKAVTFTAQWEKNQVTPPATKEYTVTFKRGGENIGIADQKVTKGEKVTKPQDPTDATKTFMYWVDEDGIEFDFDTPITGNLNLEAIFRIVASYEVGEGATGTAPANDVYKMTPQSFTLPNKTADMVKEGYKFAGWSDGKKTYKAGASYTLDHSVKFVAVWEEATGELTVTFDPNNADEPQTWTVKVASGDTVAKPATDPTIEGGKLFHYWADASGVEYDFTTPVTADITLKAKYDNRITFSLGEGVEGEAPAVIWFGYRTQLTYTTPVRAGYTFKCWTDGTNEYKSGDYITATVTLTAVWEDESAVPPVATYTITFRKANTWDEDVLATITGEIPTMKNKEVGAKFNLPANPFTRQYYEFAGWSDGTTTYQPNDEYTMSAKNVVFRAVWKEVFYDAMTADGWSGYIFLPDIRDGSYTDGVFDYYDESLYVDEDSYCYQRIAFAYTITGNTLNITSPFTAQGTLKIGGVNITINYQGTQYVFGTIEPTAPTITFDANGGTGTDPVCTPEYNSNSGMYKIILPANPYTAPENMAFKCWSVGENEYKAGTSFMAKSGETVVIKAVWESTEPEPAFEGVAFVGSCKTPTKSNPLVGTQGGETYVKFIVNVEKMKVGYLTSEGIEKVVDATDEFTSSYKPNKYGSDAADWEAKYGSDALYWSVKMESVSYYLLIKADMTKLLLCNSNDEPLTDGEFTVQGEWQTILTGEGSDFYNETKLYFTKKIECDNTTFLGLRFSKTSDGNGGYRILVRTIFVSSGAEKELTTSIMFKNVDSENGSLLVFESTTVNDTSGYRIILGKKSDGKYYVTYFKYKATANAYTGEMELSGTTAPAF